MHPWQDRARPWLSAGFALLTLSLLPGCGNVSRLFARPSPSPPPRPASASIARSSAQLHGGPPPAEVGLPAASAKAPVPPPPAAPVAREALGTPPPPIVLTGMSASGLVRLLGQPATRSPTGQGERWTYRDGTCELDVFIFPDVVRGEPAVLDERVSAAASGPAAAQACLQKLRHDHI